MLGELRTTLKGFFEAGDRPNDTQFESLLDSVIIQNDSNGDSTDTTTLLGGIEIQGDSYFTNNNTVSMNGNFMVGALHTPFGTQNATHPFQVYGSQDESIILSSGSISDVSFEGVSSNATSSIKLRDNYEDGGVHFGTHTGKAFIKVNEQELFHITGSTTGGGFETFVQGNFEVMGGDVGIGTTTPEKKLHVFNGELLVEPVTFAASQDKYILKAGAHNSTGFDGWGIKLKSDGSGTPFFSFVDSAGSGNTDRVVIKNGGNVGIGLSTPSSLLHIFEDDNSDISSNLNTGQIVLEQDGTGDAGITYLLTGTQRFSTFIDNSNSNAFTIRDNSNTSNAITIKPNVGGIGIYNTTPAHKLDVTGTFRATGVATFGDNVSVEGRIQFPTVADTGGSFPIRHEALRFPGTDDSAFIDYGFTADDAYEIRLVLQDNNTDRFKIISNATGTSNDFTALDINGDSARFFQDNGTNDGYVTIGDTTADRRLRIKSRAVNSDVLVIEGSTSGHDIVQLSELTNGSGHIDLLDGSGNNDVRISASDTNSWIRTTGKFGVGTTAPSQKLHVKGNDHTAIQVDSSGGTNKNAFIKLTNDAQSFSLKTIGSNDHLYIVNETSGTSPFKITSDAPENNLVLNNGKIGIGTDTPEQKLDVAGGHIQVDSGYGIGRKIGDATQEYIIYPYLTGMPTSFSTITALGTIGAEGMSLQSDRTINFIETDNNTLVGHMDLNNKKFDWDGALNADSISLKNGIQFIDTSQYLLSFTTATNWGLYWNTSNNQFQFHNNGSTKAFIDLDNGDAQFDGELTVDGGLTVNGTTSFTQGFRTFSLSNSGASNTGWYKLLTFPYSTYTHEEFKIVYVAGGNSQNNDKLADIAFLYKNQNGSHQFTANVINMGKIPFGAGKLSHPGTSEDGVAHIAVHRSGTATSGTIHVFIKNTSTHDTPTLTIIGKVNNLLTYDGTFIGNNAALDTVVGGFSNNTWDEYRINAGITSKAGDAGIKTGFGITSPAFPIDVFTEESQAAYINIKTTNDDGGGTGADHVGFQMENNNQKALVYTSPAGDFKLSLYEGGQTFPFTIKTGAPNHSLFVRDDGGVNINTSSANLTAKLYIQGRSLNWNETIQGTGVGTIHLDPGSSTDFVGNAITFGASDSSSGTTGQAGIYVRSDGSFGTKMYFSTTNSYATGAKTAMFIGHDGKIGIGTTNPSHQLEVDGTISTNGGDLKLGDDGVILWSDNTDAAAIFFESTGDAAGQSRLIFETRDNGDEPLIFRQKHSSTAHERMRIHTNGYVGIGHNTPAAPLEIQTVSGVGGIKLIQHTDSDIISWSGGGMRIMTDQGGLSIGSDSSLVLHAGDHRAQYEQHFAIANTTTHENLRLTADGNVIATTNMQNGNTSEFHHFLMSAGGSFRPSRMLIRTNHHFGHLEGSYNNIGNNSSKTNPIYSIGSSYNPNEETLNNFYGIGYSHNTNAGFLTNGGGPNSWGLYVAADGDARAFIAASNNGRTYFNTGGKVGIGTSSPTGKLTVNGTTAEGFNSGITLQRDGTTLGHIVVDTEGMKLKTPVANDSFYFRNSANSTVMFIGHQGFVQIGGNDAGTNLNFPMGLDGTDDMGAYLEVQNETGGDSKASVLAVMSSAQGDGVVYVGQSTAHGGGIMYKGDATAPAEFANLRNDQINIFRTTSSTTVPVISFPHNSSRVGINVASDGSRVLHMKQVSANAGIKITYHDTTVYWAIDAAEPGAADNDSNALRFVYNGAVNAWLDASPKADQLDFTGQHRNKPSSGPIGNYSQKIGYIVIADGTYDNLDDNNQTTPMINESLPKVALSTQANDKRVFGVISDSEDYQSTERHFAQGALKTNFAKRDNDDRLIINSIGEGGIWVSNYNGNLENGDYITTSPIEGIGMKQDDDLLHNYTVAKITQDCDFASETTDVTYGGETFKMKFVGCTYHCG